MVDGGRRGVLYRWGELGVTGEGKFGGAREFNDAYGRRRKLLGKFILILQLMFIKLGFGETT